MKLIENKWRFSDGFTATCVQGSEQDKCYANDSRLTLLGQVATEIEIPKKELKRVVEARTYRISDGVMRISNDQLPFDAYDVEIHYKVKE